MKINLPPVSSTTEPAVHCSFRPTIMGLREYKKLLAILTLYVAIELHYGTAFWAPLSLQCIVLFVLKLWGLRECKKLLAILTLYVAIELHYGTAFWGRILTHSPTQPCNNR